MQIQLLIPFRNGAGRAGRCFPALPGRFVTGRFVTRPIDNPAGFPQRRLAAGQIH
jgi:hypothetical protein